MANELLNPVAILQESLKRFENTCVGIKYVDRTFDDKFAVANDKVGYVVNVRIPVRFRGRIGDAFQGEDIVETSVPVKVDRLWGVDLNISDQDLLMTIDRFGERYIDPAVDTIASKIDKDILDCYKGIYNFFGTPGSPVSDVFSYNFAKARLAKMGVPLTDMSTIIDHTSEAYAVKSGSTLFNPADTIEKQYKTGNMGMAFGMKFSSDQLVQSQTIGTLTGSTPIVTVAGQTGNAILTSGWAVSTTVLKEGDIVSFTGVNAVNGISFTDLGYRRTFVVTQDIVSDSGGLATLNISPDLNPDPTSTFQTCTASPAASAPIFVYETAAANFANITGVTSIQNLMFNRQAIALVTVRQELPGGLDWSEQITHPKLGLPMRLTRAWSPLDNRRYTRLEVLGGVSLIRPEFALRVAA